MKYEWKKRDKELYGAKRSPSLITVPRQNYIMISGVGNPNGQDFSNRVAALHAFAYAIKMGYKSLAIMNGSEIRDFSIFPLEVVWNLPHSDILTGEKMEYTIMIRQPDFVAKDTVTSALERLKAKKPNSLYSEMCFDIVQGGEYIEILHMGPYGDKSTSFTKMAQFIKDHGLTRTDRCHREIYLNNPKRIEASKLKTVLRCSVIALEKY